MGNTLKFMTAKLCTPYALFSFDDLHSLITMCTPYHILCLTTLGPALKSMHRYMIYLGAGGNEKHVLIQSHTYTPTSSSFP